MQQGNVPCARAAHAVSGQADMAAVDTVFCADFVDERHNGIVRRFPAVLVGGQLRNEHIGRNFTERSVCKVLWKTVCRRQNRQVTAFSVSAVQVDDQRHIRLRICGRVQQITHRAVLSLGQCGLGCGFLRIIRIQPIGNFGAAGRCTQVERTECKGKQSVRIRPCTGFCRPRTAVFCADCADTDVVFVLCGAVKYGGKLFACNRVRRTEAAIRVAVEQTVLHAPRQTVSVPACGIGINEICTAVRCGTALDAPEYRCEHGAGQVAVRRETAAARTVKPAVFGHILDRIIVPCEWFNISERSRRRRHVQRRNQQT